MIAEGESPTDDGGVDSVGNNLGDGGFSSAVGEGRDISIEVPTIELGLSGAAATAGVGGATPNPPKSIAGMAGEGWAAGYGRSPYGARLDGSSSNPNEPAPPTHTVTASAGVPAEHVAAVGGTARSGISGTADITVEPETLVATGEVAERVDAQDSTDATVRHGLFPVSGTELYLAIDQAEEELQAAKEAVLAWRARGGTVGIGHNYSAGMSLMDEVDVGAIEKAILCLRVLKRNSTSPDVEFMELMWLEVLSALEEVRKFIASVAGWGWDVLKPLVTSPIGKGVQGYVGYHLLPVLDHMAANGPEWLQNMEHLLRAALGVGGHLIP